LAPEFPEFHGAHDVLADHVALEVDLVTRLDELERRVGPRVLDDLHIELPLAKAGDGPEVLVVDVDLGRSEDVRRWWPFLRDRRVDAYGPILNRYLGS